MIFQNLGLTDYEETLLLQRETVASVQQGEAERVFLTEHKPVYTLGRHGKEGNIIHIPEGVKCIRIERGGDITYHAPGQLVVYPVLNLWSRRLGVKEYVNTLEQWVIDILADYGIKGERAEGAPGVWIGIGTTRERKICALGLAVKRGVTMHGFALNASIDLRGFGNINPCGFIDKGVTSIERETDTPLDMKLLMKKAEELCPF